MRLLVTGGAGFIGSNFIRHILKKYPDFKIVNLDKLTYAGNLDNLKDIENNPNYQFIKGDICDKEIVEKLAKDIDIIINFAAETHVDRSIEDAGVFIKSDILGTYNLLEAVKKFNIKKFIQISTDEVYGSTENNSFKETDSLKPNSPYSASKAGADLLVRSYIKTHNVPAIITRSSNNYGPYQYPEKLIPLFVTNLLENKKIPLYGDGLNVRDWLYVIDNCEAIDFVLQNGKEGEIYNIGSGSEITNLEITKTILKELNKDETNIDFVKDRLGHDFRYSLDCSKINTLGWKPRFNFEQSIKETINWYKNNESWWKKIKSN
ncbi:MAG: dTDP-glucose 4,6-dehydratase [Candidatus Woesearchaeota archaeon]|jgi:dTDP-glucose 4,6-dehydratase|nr:dTDP-glucose 4,6-dehydratase [Candidatus Woesearchaeota archaeon]